MSEKRRALGRGLGALIPSGTGTAERPVDVFFRDQDRPAAPGAEPDAGLDGSGSADGSGQPARGVGCRRNGRSRAPDDGSALRPVPGAEFAEIPLDQIRPNPRQPRTVFDEDELEELVSSIREIGVLQPVVVRRVPEDARDGEVRYELIMGERRWRASRAAGKDVVPAIIKVTEEDDLLRDALLENLHRSQLNALEEAAAYQQLLDDFGCTQEELGRRIHRSRPQISNTLAPAQAAPARAASGRRRRAQRRARPRAARPARCRRHGADGPADRGRGPLGPHRRGARHPR